MNAHSPGLPQDSAGPPGEEGIDPGRQLIRVGETGSSLAERVAATFHRLSWRTPLHSLYLRGRHPLKLLAVPTDPVAGDGAAGAAMLAGEIRWLGERATIEGLDFAAPRSAGFADHLQSFAWLRDLATAATRERGARIAEELVTGWLATHGGNVDTAGWRPDLWGRRILNWAGHAPLILSSADLIYRSAVLNALARGARHLDRSAEKAPLGLPRIAAWSGVVAAGLLIPGGEARLARGEHGFARALGLALHPDGGIVSRSPVELLSLVDLLAQLQAVYDVRRLAVPPVLSAGLARAVPALLGTMLGDGRLSSWQGGGPLDRARVEAVIAGSAVRARPQRQSREWGYQRMSGGQTLLVADCAPPPASRIAHGGCASTLAFELSDGTQRLVVNCGGDRPAGKLPRNFAEALRATAAHSTLVLGDTNSTSIHADGSLGRGVGEVELERQEQELASRIDAGHDGYVRRFGLSHQRQLVLGADGRELRGEDLLLPAGRRRAPAAIGFAIRFHLAPRIEATVTADGMGALLRPPAGAAWQFRCRGAMLALEDSVWIDGAGRPLRTQQLVVTGEAPAGGTSVAWLFKRAG